MAPRLLLRIALVLGFGLATVLGLAAAWDAVVQQGEQAGLFDRIALGPLLGAVGLWLLASLLAGPRFARLLPPDDRRLAPSGLHLGTWMVAVHALNLALPGPAGDVAFAAAVSRTGGAPLATVVAAVSVSRVVGLATTAVLGLAVLPWLPVDSGLAAVVAGGTAVAALGGAALGLLGVRPRVLRGVANATVGRLAGAKRGGAVAGGIHRGVLGLADGLSKVGTGRTPALVEAMGWSLAIQGCLCGALALACAAVGMSADPLGLVAAHLVGELASVAVAVAPAGIGGFDAALVAALVAFGAIAGEAAALVAITLRLVQVLALASGTALVAVFAPAVLVAAQAAGPDGKNVP